MAKFSVGDVAIITYSDWDEWPVGTDVTILEVLDHPVYQYLIARLEGGFRMFGSDKCLRPKNPPRREELGEWELCPWQPSKVTA